jgi:hypothetical protein
MHLQDRHGAKFLSHLQWLERNMPHAMGGYRDHSSETPLQETMVAVIG